LYVREKQDSVYFEEQKPAARKSLKPLKAKQPVGEMKPLAETGTRGRTVSKATQDTGKTQG